MIQVAKEIVQVFQQAGHTCFWAGGCVRDQLLGREPEDYDIVTSAEPDEIERIIRSSHLLDEAILPIGKSFGVIMARVEGHAFEIATFRQDSDMSDGRRPDSVTFSTPEQDAMRRDFTINGLFYDPIREQIHDFVDGEQDLKQGVIRFIGDPDKRIVEDYLRILRAVRFKLTFDFDYDPATRRALEQNAEYARRTSSERVLAELRKLMKIRSPEFTFDLVIQELESVGLLRVLLPEIAELQEVFHTPDQHLEGSVYRHTLRALKSMHHEVDEKVVWAVLFHDVGKKTVYNPAAGSLLFRGHEAAGAEVTRQVLKRLNFSRADRELVVWLVEHHMTLMNFFKMKDGTRRKWFLDPRFPLLLEVFRADAAGSSPTDMTPVNELEEIYERDREELLLMPPQNLLTGAEVMEIFNLIPGPKVGQLLKLVREAQLEGVVSSKQQAVEYLKRRKAC